MRVDVRHEAASGELLVTVRDNGPGVPTALREAIFVRGFSTKPDVLGGRGIGLPLVQVVCSQRGGRLTVREEAGAVFEVVLPRSSQVLA